MVNVNGMIPKVAAGTLVISCEQSRAMRQRTSLNWVYPPVNSHSYEKYHNFEEVKHL